LKKRCGIRYTVKVAKDTDRERKKFSRAKNARATNLSFDSRQSNTEEDTTYLMKEIRQIYLETEKRKCKHTLTHIVFHREKFPKKSKERKIHFLFSREIHLTC